MDSARNSQPDNNLRSVITHAETEAVRLLDTADSIPLDAVAWLSAHLAALDHAVYPVVKRSFADGRLLVSERRNIAARLMRSLRVVERRHSGDALAAGLDPARLNANVRTLLTEHHAASTQLVDRLVDTLDNAALSRLLRGYQTALEHAPTRPHPHTSRGGLMFRLDALRDNLLDTLDGRHVPVPRLPRRNLTPGRWGAYFLGQPQEQKHDAV